MNKPTESSATADGAWVASRHQPPAADPSLPSKADNAAASTVSDFAQRVYSAEDALRAKTEQLRLERDEWVEGLRGKVRRNPLSAIAAAFAFGALLSRILR